MSIGPFNNRILQNLDMEVIGRLQLRRVQLPVRHNLEVPGEIIQNLVFIEGGVGSMSTAFANGVQVETSMFGYESIVGVSALMGAKQSLNRIFMQLAGYGYTCDVARAQSEFSANGVFQQLAIRYMQRQLTI